MPDTSTPESGLGIPAAPASSIFHENTQLRLCTANVCKSGHEWIPKVTLAKCGYGTPQGWNGCGSPVLAVKLENCPVCNEPPFQMRFRTDHTPPTQFILPICIPGTANVAESTEVVLTRNYELVEAGYDKKFPPLGVPDPSVTEKCPDLDKKETK
jgi:hypothetical protein